MADTGSYAQSPISSDTSVTTKLLFKKPLPIFFSGVLGSLGDFEKPAFQATLFRTFLKLFLLVVPYPIGL